MWSVITGNFTYILWAGAGAILLWLLLLVPYRWFIGVAFAADTVCEELSFLFFGCLLGLTVGIVTGHSREAAVGAVVPAILTLIGALVGYLYSGPNSVRRVTKFSILIASIALTIFFFWGTYEGASRRFPWDQYARALELQKLQYMSALELNRMKYQADLERYKIQLETHKAAERRKD